MRPIRFIPFLFSCGALLLATPVTFAATDLDNPALELQAEQYPSAVERLMREGKYDRALEYIEDGLIKNPLSAQLKFLKCVLFERTGQELKAKEELEAFIKTYPEIPEAYNNLARIITKTGDLDRAEDLLNRAIALRPNYVTARENLGNIELTRAIRNFRIAARGGSRTAKARLHELEQLVKQ